MQSYDVLEEIIMGAINNYKKTKNPRFIYHAKSLLNEGDRAGYNMTQLEVEYSCAIRQVEIFRHARQQLRYGAK